MDRFVGWYIFYTGMWFSQYSFGLTILVCLYAGNVKSFVLPVIIKSAKHTSLNKRRNDNIGINDDFLHFARPLPRNLSRPLS